MSRPAEAPRAIITSTIPLTLATFHNELIRQVQQAGYAVTVVSSPGEQLAELARRHDLATVAIPMAREIDPRGDARALQSWVRVCRQVRPQLIVAATPKASLLGMLAGRTTGVPRRLYYLGGLRLEGESGRRREILRRMERLTGGAATHVVANSPSLTRRALDLGLFDAAKLFVTVPGSSHGVDSTRFAPTPADPRLRDQLGLRSDRAVVGFVGRLTHDKGIDDLLEALRSVRAGGTEVQLLVVGDQLEPDSRHYADLLNGAGDTVFSGNQRDVRPYYALMDLLVLPSLREGFPNVVLEASAMGLPTVTTDATGCVDSVVPDVTGIIVPVRRPDELAGAIARLVDDPAERRRMGESARERVVRDFREPDVVRSLLAPVLEPAVARSARPARPSPSVPPPPARSLSARPDPPHTLVTVTAYGEKGASSRVRVFDWLRHLDLDAERHSYRDAANNRPAAILRDPRGTARAERDLRALDTSGRRLLISREASPWSDGSIEERLLRRAGHGVYDLDDALFADPSRLKARLGLADRSRRATAAADVVIAGNDYLADWASRHNRDVRVIPSCIEPRDYPVTSSWRVGEVPVIAWLGSASTEAYLVDIMPALLDVNLRTGARLRLISSPQPNPALAPLFGMLDRVPWRADTFATELGSADVAIGPVTDSAWARGKCAYKLLQYAAAGLPMAASPVGANALALHRFSGVPVDSPSDWGEALLHLLGSSAGEREERGRTARAAVKQHYSFDAWADEWRSAVMGQ